MGGKNTTTTSTTQASLPPVIQDAYQNLFDQAQWAYSRNSPSNASQAAQVAPFSQQQLDAFGNIDKLGSVSTPYLNDAMTQAGLSAMPNANVLDAWAPAAQNYATSAGTAISDLVPGLTAAYQSPYEDDVVKAAIRDMAYADSLQQNDLLGRAITSGASPFGGDRAGVAAAELARNQSMARNSSIAGLRDQGYQTARSAALSALTADRSGAATAAQLMAGLGSQALGAAQADRTAAANAAQLYGGLGQQAFDTALKSANAQLQSGALQQQQSQNELDVARQNYLEQLNFEKNNVSWLASVLSGAPAPVSSTTTSTQPGPSALNSILGLGTALVGLLKDGGRVPGFDTGGTVRPVMPAALRQDPTDLELVQGGDGGDLWVPAPVTPATLKTPPPDPAAVAAAMPVAAPQAAGPTAGLAPAPTPVAGGAPIAGLRDRLSSVINDPVKLGLVAGGLAAAGSDSPFPMVAVGQGLTAGLAAAIKRRADQEEQQRRRDEAAADRALKQKELDQKYVLLDKGDNYQLYYPSTKETVDLGIPIPKTPAGSETERELLAEGLKPGTPEYTRRYEQLKRIGSGIESADDKLRMSLSAKEGERWSALQEAGVTSAGVVQDLGALRELLKVAPQGPITGRLAEMFPGFSAAGDAVEAVVKRAAPALRTPGSGSTSDIEYEGMLKSLPRLRNTPEGNQAILEMMDAKSKINIDRADVVSAFNSGDIDATEARRRLDALNRQSIVTPAAEKVIQSIGGFNYPSAEPADAKPTEVPGMPGVTIRKVQ